MPVKRVLLVDDDRDFLRELDETLRLSGYDVEISDDAANVVDLAVRRRPDVIVMDMKMAGMTGFEVAKNLSLCSSTARIPVIAMSGYFDEARDCTLFDYFKINKCLQKPFNPLDIISQIESIDKDAGSKS